MFSLRMPDVHELARSYIEAAINGGEPAPIHEVAAWFIAAFPDIEVVMDDLVVGDGGVELQG